MDDQRDKMVLRFANEQEISLYFDIVDQLSKIVILKGRRVLLEPDYYAKMMNNYLDVCQRYMLFLCKDEMYARHIDGKLNERDTSDEYIDLGLPPHLKSVTDIVNLTADDYRVGYHASQHQQDLSAYDSQHNGLVMNERCTNELKVNQKLRFLKRERHHRGFIRAYLFDMVFKAFLNILDEALCQKEIYIQEKKK